MAPRKRRNDEEVEEKAEITTEKPNGRVTRSSSSRNTNSIPQSDVPKLKKMKKEVAKSEAPASEKVVSDRISLSKTIVIEHCKQCNSFKTRAIQVKNGLENAVSGITVLVNPEKPRRGCFEIREEGGEKFITLLDMKRPFAPMKALDMDKVISDVIDKIK